MRFKSIIGKPLRWLLGKVGYALVQQNRFGFVPIDEFGHDPYRDIRLLNERWNSTVRTFFDVGANVGSTSLRALREFPEAQIFAFEPHPTTFLSLRHATEKHPRIHAVETALAAEATERVMHTYDASLLNSLAPNARFAVRFGLASVPIRIQVSTVDQFSERNNIDKIDVLKIDTEGFDLEVLRGAQALLERGAISFIYFEFNDIVTDEKSAGGALAPIDELLRRYNYRFVASYNDYIVTEGKPFAVSNALYAFWRGLSLGDGMALPTFNKPQ